MIKENSDWDLIIFPKTPLFDLRMRQVWRYRDLLLLLVKRDFISFYKQTVLGPLWFVIQPLFTVCIYVFIFGNLAGIPTDGIPKPLFYLTGITGWTYFSECFLKISNVFRDNSAIFGKVYFPRLIMPLSIVISSLIKFCVQLTLLLLMIVYYSFSEANIHISLFLVFFPVLIVLMAFLALGMGLIVTSVTTKYRDFALLLSFSVSLLIYACPVVYPLSSLSNKYKLLVSLNPMTTIIESMRKILLGQGTVSILSISYTVLITGLILISGIIIFNRVEKNFVDTI